MDYDIFLLVVNFYTPSCLHIILALQICNSFFNMENFLPKFLHMF